MSRQDPGNRVHSMTGFARVRKTGRIGELTLSLRSVNHRGLDLHFHTPAEFDPLEGTMRKEIAAWVKRGHIDIRVSWQRSLDDQQAGGSWNRLLFQTWLAAFRAAASQHNLPCEPDLNSAFRIPGMLSVPAEEDIGEDAQGQIMDALREALSHLNEVRAREGAETAQALLVCAGKMRAAAGEIEAIRDTVLPDVKARLEERLSELLRSAPLDPQRIMQEAAVLADRSDIVEEVTRLKIHAVRLEELLQQGGEIGKKLEFLAQEMQRETNTILSKSNAAGESGRRITALALVLKSDIERIKEQSLNLE